MTQTQTDVTLGIAQLVGASTWPASNTVSLPILGGISYAQWYSAYGYMEIGSPLFSGGQPGLVEPIDTTATFYHPSTVNGFPGQFTTQIDAATGAYYVIEASTYLVHWNVLMTNTSPDAPYLFTDPLAGIFGARFYRVQQAP